MANTPIAFPQTYDAAQAGPNYSASDFRLTAGAALAVPDGSAFGGIQGVRAGSPSPLATIDGTTVTVAPHMGWLCPWAGGCYMYALPEPQQVAVDSTTGSYKIAVVLEDRAAGHGSGERVGVQQFPGYTLDSQIPGLVVARVESGVASDAAPVIGRDATIRVATLAQLQAVTAADGVGAVLADGSRYERSSGVWRAVRGAPVRLVSSQYGTITGVRSGGVAQVSIDWKSAAGGSWDTGSMGRLPEGWRPAMAGVYPYQGRDGGSQRQISIDTDGNVKYQNCGSTQNMGGFSISFTYLLA